MLRLAPGGPFDEERQIPDAIKAKLLAYYGLDKPWYQQYAMQMGKLIRGDLGFSFKYPNRTVNGVIGNAAPVSLELGLYALTVSVGLGLIAGVIASLKPNTALDYIPSSAAMIGVCLPTFLLGPILILVFVSGTGRRGIDRRIFRDRNDLRNPRPRTTFREERVRP